MKSTQGFLLIEVLTALLILSVALTVFLGSTAASLRLTGRAEKMTQAVLQSEKVLFQRETDGQ